MAKPQYTWSVRGISHEARDRAKNAAQNRSVTIGEWVSLALIELADEELTAAPDSLPPITAPEVIAEAAGLGARERALLALVNRPPPAKTKAEHEQQAPWSVRSVSQVARVKAAQAAAHRRVTIGEWVNHAILAYADRVEGIESAAAAPTPEAAPVTEKTMKLVQALARHIDETGTATPDGLPAETRPPPAAPQSAALPTVAPTAPTPPVQSSADSEHTDHELSQLAELVQENERRNEQRLATLTSALTIFADRLKLAGGRPAAAEPAPAPAAPAAAERPVNRPAAAGNVGDHLSEAELAFWESIKDSENRDDYEAYLETFPDGVFAPLARTRTAHPAPVPRLAAPGAAPAPRRPPAGSYPKFDYDTLNERAIENTKRLQDKD